MTCKCFASSIGLSQICSKFAQNASRNFPKISPIFVMLLSGRQCQPGAVFQLCPVTQSHNMSRVDSWVAGARVRFLPKETQQQPGIDSRHRTWNLAITRLMPRPLSYYYLLCFSVFPLCLHYAPKLPTILSIVMENVK